MAQQLAGFPKELNVHLSDRIDKIYLISFWSNFVFWFSLIGYLQSLPTREMSSEDLEKYMRAIYDVKPQKIVREKVVKEVAETGAKTVEIEEVVEKTSAEKAADRSANRARRQAQMRSAREAARSAGIFAAAGAMRAGRGGARGKRVGKGLSGGFAGVDAGKLLGMATTSADVAAIERLRGGGAITEGGGGIDITQLSLKDLQVILQASSVEIDDVPEVKGAGGSATASRSGSDILGVVQREQSKLKNCYNTQKKKDPNLKGKLTVMYTIKTDGSVQKIRMKNSQWTNPSLGKKVEMCVKKRLQRWKFGTAAGDVSTNFSLSFI
ncbi:MAG: AgmX/PglI C-terminal domain-containing protein [Candidatus Electryonea clarkiae]|nr:AgmX/PglI C-terminal domain-containing protein [Candidatus Electryonea clarkiae]MDP8286260.1 AgmX/PglI C-terminal domain-containing protein [Candidatus Electryonea clarkiae]